MVDRAVTNDILLELYVAGMTPTAVNALRNLREICQLAGVESRCRIEVVDILESPQRAEDEKILATPTVVKRTPAPESRMVGDLSNSQQVLSFLNLG